MKTAIHNPHLLILSFSYSPMRNPRAFRWTALAEEFASRGVRVRVVCSWQPGLPQRQILNGVEVYRAGNRFIESIRACFAQLRRNSHQILVAQPSKRSRASLGAVGSLFWRQIAWPDTTCVWYGAARQKADILLRKCPGTTVVSVSPAFTAALVGYSVTKGNGLRWVIDMGDPFSIADGAPPNNFLFYKSLNQRAERTLFQNAGAVTLTNSKIQERYSLLYPESADKMHVIPPLLSDMPFRVTLRSKPRKSCASVRIIYVGTLYKRLRRPDFLLTLFEGLVAEGKLTSPELHFFGNCEECIDSLTLYKKRIGKMLYMHGVVAQQDTFKAISTADLVVNLGNTNTLQLPSKLVEYAAMGTPILNIIRAEEDPSEDFLKDYGAVLNLRDVGRPPTTRQIALTSAFIEKSINERGNLVDNRWMEKFNKSAIADQYSSVLFGGDH